MTVFAISVSRDHKWIVCGTVGAGVVVWDGEMQDKVRVIDVEGENMVDAVDVSPDSTRFATGTRTVGASVWSVTNGERLVGPLKHENDVNGVRFSPPGDRIATACYSGIRIFDSHTGDQLLAIEITMHNYGAITPLAWSSDGQQIFATSEDKKIRSFNVSTGSLLVESQILHDGHDNVHSIALAANGKFIATFADRTISLLDTSTLTRIVPVFEDSEQIWSLTISPDSSYLATGRRDGKIVIRDLGKIIPDVYGPLNVSICAFILLAC